MYMKGLFSGPILCKTSPGGRRPWCCWWPPRPLYQALPRPELAAPPSPRCSCARVPTGPTGG
jgi:hypothetical protein